MHISHNAAYWVHGLDLMPHPEGGYYRESYRSDITMDLSGPGTGSSGTRSIATSIFYLLESPDFSAFHRIRSDEVWHHYAGGTLLIHMIGPDGRYWRQGLASSLVSGALPQWTVPAGTWFAARPESSYSLVGCSVSPGFDFQDFELAKRAELVRQFPAHSSNIESFTRS